MRNTTRVAELSEFAQTLIFRNAQISADHGNADIGSCFQSNARFVSYFTSDQCYKLVVLLTFTSNYVRKSDFTVDA